MTTRPKFTLRLTAAIVAATITLGGLSGCGGGSDSGTAAPVNPPLIGAEETASDKALSWLERVAESLYEVALGAAAIAHGNLAAGLFDVAAGALGLIGKGVESGETGDSQAEEITKIDKKLDTLIVDVRAIDSKVSDIEKNIGGMDAWQKNNAAMHDPMAQAQTWLESYYNNPAKPEQSREWVRWYLAGCTYGVNYKYLCPSAENPASAAQLAKFRQTYMQNPTQAPPTLRSNFPLWWAYGVIGNKGVETFKVVNSADDIVTNIYYGLTNFEGQDTNGLISYMNLVLNDKASGCNNDLTDKNCDLLEVYKKLEAYFILAIGRQSQLVMALAEAKNVLAQKDFAANGTDVNTLMSDFNQKLNHQAEAFLQAAEQLALYRAADGRTDWSNFADMDAGRLLARADFVVARLAGRNYLANATIVKDYRNPPWPLDGIVGRVFYTKNEQIPNATATRSVCSSGNKSTCSIPLILVSETAASRAITGVQPYLEWTSELDKKTGAVTRMTGTVNRQWVVQRLAPQPNTQNTATIIEATDTTPATYIITTTTDNLTTRLPVGDTYLVNSTKPSSDTQLTGRWPAQLGFYNYDENFTTPPVPGTQSVIPFGSFSSVEGAIGRYGLKLEPNSFIKSDVDMPSFLYADKYGASNAYPGAAKYYVRYVPNKNWNGSTFNQLDGSVGDIKGTWSASTAVQLVNPEGSAIKVKVSWPSAIDVDLKSQFVCSGAGCAGRDEYYSYVKFKQQILDGSGTAMNSGSVVNDDCHSDPFKYCRIQQADKAVDTDFMLSKASPSTKLSFKATFSTEVNQYTKKPAFLHFDETARTSIETSYTEWDIQAPLFTLIK